MGWLAAGLLGVIFNVYPLDSDGQPCSGSHRQWERISLPVVTVEQVLVGGLGLGGLGKEPEDRPYLLIGSQWYEATSNYAHGSICGGFDECSDWLVGTVDDVVHSASS